MLPGQKQRNGTRKPTEAENDLTVLLKVPVTFGPKVTGTLIPKVTGTRKMVMKYTKKLLLLWFLVIVMLSGCGKKFNPNNYIGKTSAEIIDEYGEFDYAVGEADDTGLYRSTKCGYTSKEKQRGFFGTSEEEFFFIYFDQNGVAHKCDYGVRPGG